MIYKMNCKICGKEFVSNNVKYIETAHASCSRKLKKHIKEEHKISIQEYIDKVYYKNIRPTCLCGCGKPVTFTEKNCFFDDEMHGYGKYYHCSHVWKNQKYKDNHTPNKYISKFNDIEWLKHHYDDIYGWDNIVNSAKDFLNEEYSNEDIEKKYTIDRRTIKKIWLKFGLVTEEEYKKIAYKNKYERANKHRRIIFTNAEEICEKIYLKLKKFPLKYTIHSVIKEFNNENLIQIEQDPRIVLDKLVEFYGEIIYDYLQIGYHSKEEIEFIKILKFYFGKSKIITGKKIQYGKNKKEVYIYDICINDKIIIEYDSGGLYHPDKKRDKEKENFAINKGYIFLRISKDYSKNPNLIIKIKKILNI